MNKETIQSILGTGSEWFSWLKCQARILLFAVAFGLISGIVQSLMR